MDFVSGGDIRFHLNQCHRMSERSAQMIGAETVLALEYLHSKQIIFR